jgi:hypothetical protein
MALATPGGGLSTPRARLGAREPGSQLFRLGAAGIGAIWAAVVFISLLAPDNVSGTEQEHVPVAAILTWIWGLVASKSLVTTLAAQRAHPERVGDVRVLVAAIAGVWVVAALVGAFGPEIVSGTDPTHTPIAAILAPIAGMVITTTACQMFGSLVGDKGDKKE